MLQEKSHKEKVMAAAVLTCEGVPQEEIARLLGVRQSAVSKMLVEARNQRLIAVQHPKWLGDEHKYKAIVAERYKDKSSLYELLVEVAIAEKGQDPDAWPGFPAKRIRLTYPLQGMPILYPSYAGPVTTRQPDWSQAVKNWAGSGVAATVHNLLASGTYAHGYRYVGVGWGRHIRAVCDAMRNLSRHRLKDPLDFVPLMPSRNVMIWERGDDVFTNPYEVSSNELAFDFYRVLNGDARAREASLDYYLPGVDFIPFGDAADEEFPFGERLSNKELAAEGEYIQTIRRKFFGAFDAYRKTFGFTDSRSPRALSRVECLDAMIVAVGDPSASLLFDKGDVSRYAGIPYEWFLANTLGDIASVLLPNRKAVAPRRGSRHTLDVAEGQKVGQQFERIQRRWTGVTLDHIRRCADHARLSGSVGVIVLAVGESRAEVVIDCLRRGLVNHLFIDLTLQDGLERKLKELRQKPHDTE